MSNYNKEEQKTYLIEFGFIDFLFFRDDKNFKNFIGNTQQTLLVPNKRTLIGALRNYLAVEYAKLNSTNIDLIWKALKYNPNNNYQDLFKWWGDINGFPTNNEYSISCHGPLIKKEDSLLYPLPAFLKIKNDSNGNHFNIIKSIHEQEKNQWIDISNNQIFNINDLFTIEDRFFNSLITKQKINNTSKIFEIETVKPISLKNKYCLLLHIRKSKSNDIIELLDELCKKTEIVQLGGENKCATLTCSHFEILKIQSSIQSSFSLLENISNQALSNIKLKYNKYTIYSYNSKIIGGWNKINNTEASLNNFSEQGYSLIKDTNQKKFKPNLKIFELNSNNINELILTFIF